MAASEIILERLKKPERRAPKQEKEAWPTDLNLYRYSMGSAYYEHDIMNKALFYNIPVPSTRKFGS